MNDRELLLLAMKAAGMEPWRQFVDESYGMGVLTPKGLWNPLTDDGDALRLAVKLHLNIEFLERENRRTLVWIELGFMGSESDVVHEPIIDDPYAATRRAIVRAAAEIGKSL